MTNVVFSKALLGPHVCRGRRETALWVRKNIQNESKTSSTFTIGDSDPFQSLTFEFWITIILCVKLSNINFTFYIVNWSTLLIPQHLHKIAVFTRARWNLFTIIHDITESNLGRVLIPLRWVQSPEIFFNGLRSKPSFHTNLIRLFWSKRSFGYSHSQDFILFKGIRFRMDFCYCILGEILWVALFASTVNQSQKVSCSEKLQSMTAKSESLKNIFLKSNLFGNFLKLRFCFCFDQSGIVSSFVIQPAEWIVRNKTCITQIKDQERQIQNKFINLTCRQN
jgi:hypothetical protein